MTRRLLLSVLLAASLLVAFEAGRASASRSGTSSIPAPAPHGEPDPSLPFPTPSARVAQRQSAPPAHVAAGEVAGSKPVLGLGVGLTGVASWGYGWAGVVTRLPRGTRTRRVAWSHEYVGAAPVAHAPIDRVAPLTLGFGN